MLHCLRAGCSDTTKGNCSGTIRIQIADFLKCGIVMKVVSVVLAILIVHGMRIPVSEFHDPFPLYACFDSCTSPHIAGEVDILHDVPTDRRLCSLKPIALSPLSPEVARCPQCGGVTSHNEWRPSMESFREHEEIILLPISSVVPLPRPLPRRSTSAIRWYRSVASVGVQPRTLFPSFWTCCLKLRRLTRGLLVDSSRR